MNDTLKGGKTVTAFGADGVGRDIFVRQLALKLYDQAFPAMDDEFGFTALCCDMSREQILELEPSVFELLMVTAKEVNTSFFAFAERRHATLAKRLNSVSPDMLKLALGNVSKPSRSGLPLKQGSLAER